MLPPLDVGDPHSFIASVVAILVQYPDEVIEAAVDPVKGIPSRTDRPTLRFVTVTCDEFYAPIARREERERIAAERAAEREPPRPPRTPEQQARIDAQVEAWRHGKTKA